MPFESELFEADVLAAFPAEVRIPARTVAEAVEAQSASAPRILVVLDDDPTGTQSVADLPVLTRWEVADFTWAFNHRINGRRQDAVYVLTNTRSLDPAEAAARNEEVVRNALAAAALETDGANSSGVSSSGASEWSSLRLGFVSRSDSTLRGHYPLEPDTIAATVAAASRRGDGRRRDRPRIPRRRTRDDRRRALHARHRRGRRQAHSGGRDRIRPGRELRLREFRTGEVRGGEVRRPVPGGFGDRAGPEHHPCRRPGRGPPGLGQSHRRRHRLGHGFHPDRRRHRDRKRSPRAGPGPGGSRTPGQEAAVPGGSAVRPGPHRPGNPRRTQRRGSVRGPHALRRRRPDRRRVARRRHHPAAQGPRRTAQLRADRGNRRRKAAGRRVRGATWTASSGPSRRPCAAPTSSSTPAGCSSRRTTPPRACGSHAPCPPPSSRW